MAQLLMPKGPEVRQWQQNKWRNGKVQCHIVQGMGLAVLDVFFYVYLVDVVNFIQTSFTRNTHKDVFRTLLRELGVTDHQILRFASWQEQSVELQAVVKRSHMTWFQFAQYLLRSRLTRPFVFKIAEYTDGEW